jgi:hypothetical protein
MFARLASFARPEVPPYQVLRTALLAISVQQGRQHRPRVHLAPIKRALVLPPAQLAPLARFVGVQEQCLPGLVREASSAWEAQFLALKVPVLSAHMVETSVSLPHLSVLHVMVANTVMCRASLFQQHTATQGIIAPVLL